MMLLLHQQRAKMEIELSLVRGLIWNWLERRRRRGGGRKTQPRPCRIGSFRDPSTRRKKTWPPVLWVSQSVSLECRSRGGGTSRRRKRKPVLKVEKTRRKKERERNKRGSWDLISPSSPSSQKKEEVFTFSLPKLKKTKAVVARISY